MWCGGSQEQWSFSYYGKIRRIAQGSKYVSDVKEQAINIDSYERKRIKCKMIGNYLIIQLKTERILKMQIVDLYFPTLPFLGNLRAVQSHLRLPSYPGR